MDEQGAGTMQTTSKNTQCPSCNRLMSNTTGEVDPDRGFARCSGCGHTVTLRATVTLGQIRVGNLPHRFTGIRWEDGWTECFRCVTDDGYTSTLGGSEYDPSDVAEVLTGQVDCDLHRRSPR